MSEYAPEYTKKERIVLGVKIIAWAALIYVVLELWFIDWFAAFAKNAHCYTYGNINGVHLVFYGLLVLLPLLFAITLFLIEGRRSVQVIRLGQNPLPGEKVFRPTKYKYGAAAKIQPYLILSIILCLLGLSVWGGLQAYEITENIKPCTSNK